MTTYRTQENDRLDQIAWRHYGSVTGKVEKILLANPGLADHGDILPSGLILVLPDLPQPDNNTGLRLWD